MEKLRQQNAISARETAEEERRIWKKQGFPILIMMIENMPSMLTSEVMKKADEYNLVLRYIPKLNLPEAILKKKGEADFSAEVNKKYPRWQISSTPKEKYEKNYRNLELEYWRLIKENFIEFPKLGRWMLIENLRVARDSTKITSRKPNRKDLLDIIMPEAYSQRSPVFCPADKLFKNLAQKKSETLSALGFSDNNKIEARLPKALELNLLLNCHPNWRNKDVFELTNDNYNVCNGISYHLAVGGFNAPSDICVVRDDEKYYKNSINGFRIAIVFNP